MTVPDASPDLPPARARALLALLGRLPQGALSRAFGRLADLPIPPRLRPALIGGFARMMGIDAAAAEMPVAAYETINRFFVRRLRPGLRSWPADPALLASPVDGTLGQLGPVRVGRLLQAKGRWYAAAALLDDGIAAERYAGGSFVTIYLSPRHYHRIHAPCPGTIPKARYIPGALLPVNAPAIAHVPDLFPRNERLICYLDAGAAAAAAGAAGAAGKDATPAEAARPATAGTLGRVAVVAVGAYNVGRISAAFDPAWNAPGGWVSNRAAARAEMHRYDPPTPIAPGAEIMAFHLGSTVVLLLEPGVILDPSLVPGRELRVGEVIARREV